MTGTQVEKIYQRQQQMRRAFETCPDDPDTEASGGTNKTGHLNSTVPTKQQDDALGAANELMTNLNIAAQEISKQTSISPPADSCLPKFDVTPQTNGGKQAADDPDQTDKGPVFDETPCGHGSSMPPTAPSPQPAINQCARSLLDFMCANVMDMDRTVIDFGGCGGTCRDIYESFADGKSLDTDFMQCFIECARHDISARIPHKKNLRFILDANVAQLLNPEEREQRSQNPQPFYLWTLQKYLDNTLPPADQLESFNSIMVPMLRGNHWTLYVVNFYKGCIHILDSNPYGPALGGTTWEMYHSAKVTCSNGKNYQWSKIIMNRLNKALQLARPNSCLPKFGNYKISLAPNCPTMKVGSNDCGFFITRYIQFYDYTDGSITTHLDPDQSREHRALLLHYLTFHELNKICPLPPEIQRFKFIAK